jgi:hypothetical protein
MLRLKNKCTLQVTILVKGISIRPMQARVCPTARLPCLRDHLRCIAALRGLDLV